MKFLGKLIEFILILAILLGLLFVGKRYGNQILALVLPEGTTVTTILETKAPETTPEIQSAPTAAPETAVPETETPETQPALQLPILDVINEAVEPGTAGSSLRAVQAAVRLLDWGVNTGLDTEEIRQATVNWLADKGNDDQAAFAQKLELVDDAYNRLREGNARELLDEAGCQDTEIFWGSDPVAPIEAVMDAVGLRG